MLGHFVAGTGYDETGAGRDVECILTVATCSYDVDGAIRTEVDGNACFHQCFAKSYQFVDCDAAHLEGGEQGGYLSFRIHLAGDVEQNLPGLCRGQFFVVEESG